MVRAILAPALVALLLAAGGASAAEDSSPSAPDLPVPSTDDGTPALPEHPSEPGLDPGEAKEAAEAVVDGVAAAVGGQLSCRDAVRVDRHWYGAMVTDRKEEDRTWVREHVFTVVTERQVPVYSEVARTAGGLLAPLGDGVAGTLRVLDHYETVPVVGHEARFVKLLADRESEYLDWERYDATAYLDPLVGAPYLATGDGRLVQVCGDEVQIVHGLSDPRWGDVDRHCWCLSQPQDGWSIRYRHVEASLATPEEVRSLPHHGWAWSADLGTLWGAAVDPLADLLFGPDDPFAPAADAPAEGTDGPAPASAAAAGAAARPLWALAGVALLAAAGLAYAARRSLR